MFKFDLANVLSLKEKLEDHKKRELGVATTRREQIQGEKQVLMEKHGTLYRSLQNANSHKLDLNHIKMSHHYGKHLNNQLKEKETQLIEANKMVNEKRNELIEAVKERKILDNLKEIRIEQYMAENLQKEAQLLDEIVSYKYGARSDD